ncbi:methyl-accepting chemotaxis protein [Clostridium sp. P21]|uniref:Methyl-accepting chemotaxis protein n=1 Tax=Clostridium muellerianum TaxID=2716538 RepID=A0A7Y0HN39_9CLOT|nr:methyl-accepting chemotaxis protein [Clostridium muellerianum]NMM62805.1 methyl-accepting chemotaxis protein [Clostridium muellerianum]
MSKLGMKILRLVLAVAGIIMAISLISCWSIIRSAESNLKYEAKESITKSINAVDRNKIEKIINNHSNNSKEYTEVLNSMIVFKAKNSIKNFYIYVKKDDKTAQFLVDASPEAADFMENYEMAEEMRSAFDGKITVDNDPYTDKWGTYVSAYAPIKNSSGQVIAAIGMDEDVSTLENIKKLFFKVSILEIMFSIIISLVSVYIFSKKLKCNIGIIEDKLSNMSDGNLQGNIELKTKDEIEHISYFLNDFRLKINSMIIGIKKDVEDAYESSDSLFSISKEMSLSAENVSSIIQNISENSAKQTSDILKIKENFDEFGENIENTAKIIGEFDIMANKIKGNSKESSSDVKLLINSINDLNFQFKAVVEKIQALGSDIDKISDITNLINDISDQTNLLALNASIEASRVGEAGRGFSVVADEIKVLAEQAKASSENISRLLKNVSSKSNDVIAGAKSVDLQFSSQINIVNSIANSFRSIIYDMEKLLPGINIVNSSVIEANNKKTVIVNNLRTSSSSAEGISVSSEEIAALAEELNSSTEEVTNSAKKLVSIVNNVVNNINKFKTEDRGNNK